MRAKESLRINAASHGKLGGRSRLLCRGLSEDLGWLVVSQQESRDLERILSRFADKWNRGFNRWVETLVLAFLNFPKLWPRLRASSGRRPLSGR